MGNQLRAAYQSIQLEENVFVPVHCAWCEILLDGVNPLPTVSLSRDGAGVIMSLWYCSIECLNKFIQGYDMYGVYDTLRTFIMRSIKSEVRYKLSEVGIPLQEHIDFFKMMVEPHRRKEHENHK